MSKTYKEELFETFCKGFVSGSISTVLVMVIVIKIFS